MDCLIEQLIISELSLDSSCSTSPPISKSPRLPSSVRTGADRRGSNCINSRAFFFHHLPGALHAAPPAAAASASASASAGGDENDEAPEDEEGDGAPPTWRAMGMPEPPTPPTKHTTQVDLTGVPQRVMNSVFKLKVRCIGWGGIAGVLVSRSIDADPCVICPCRRHHQVISCPPLFRRPWARQPTSTSFSTAWWVKPCSCVNPYLGLLQLCTEASLISSESTQTQPKCRAYDVKEKLLLTNSHCVMDGVVINVRGAPVKLRK